MKLKLLDILNLDIIVSDVEIKSYDLIKKINFKNFSLFLYKVRNKRDKKNCMLEVDIKQNFNKNNILCKKVF